MHESHFLRAAINRLIFQCVLLLAFVIFFGLWPAGAQEAPGEVNLQPLARQLLPYAVEIFLTLIFGLAAIVAAWIKKKWNVDIESQLRAIEARHRETMHSAIKTAVASAIAKGADPLTFNVGSEALARVIRYLRDSAPEAVEHFKPSPDVVAAIAKTKALEVMPAAKDAKDVARG